MCGIGLWGCIANINQCTGSETSFSYNVSNFSSYLSVTKINMKNILKGLTIGNGYFFL